MKRKLIKLKAFISKGLGFTYVFLRYKLKSKNNDIDNKQIQITILISHQLNILETMDSKFSS